MTSIMPNPLQSVRWQLDGLERAVSNAADQPQIPQEAADTFKYFAESFKRGGENMRNAMAREIAFMNGRTFPWALDADPTAAKPKDGAEKWLLTCATRLQTDYRNFAKSLDRFRADGNMSGEEAEKLTTLLQALEVGVATLQDGVKNLGDSRRHNRPAEEIFQVMKNSVNDPANDTQRGPFGLLTKFGANEAQSFIDRLGFEVGDKWEKAKEVVELLYDTAASPYGDLVLTEAAAKKFQEQLGHYAPDLDWSKAINAYKEEHPIVALYAVAIDTTLNDPARSGNVRELEAMLRAGEAAHSELSVAFVRNGPVVSSAPSSNGAITASLAAAGMTRAARAQHVDDLGDALGRLRARIAELRS